MKTVAELVASVSVQDQPGPLPLVEWHGGVKVTRSCGNVFADLGLPNAEALAEQTRAILARPKEPHRIYVDREHPYPGSKT